jgi:hypothetical protein
MSLHKEEVEGLCKRDPTEQQRKTADSLTFATSQVLSSLEIFELASESADPTEVSAHLTKIETALGELVMRYNISIVESNQ